MVKNDEKKIFESEKNIKKISDSFKRSKPLYSLNDIKEDYLNSLSTMTYEEYLIEKKQDESLNYRETFCEGFFIASYPKKNGKIIENSNNLLSFCEHKDCSKLHAMKPEILMKYPLKNTNDLEINNFIAAICFPAGIKNCYYEPNKCKEFATLITNRNGQRLYLITYHFYKKMEQSKFNNEYEIYGLQKSLQKFGEEYNNMINDNNINKQNIMEEKIKLCEKLYYKEYVYVPFCIGLISKYPYIAQIKHCIEGIFTMINSQNFDESMELNEFIMYLIHSIPIPNKNCTVKFPLPFGKEKMILIDAPKFYGMNALNNEMYFILDQLRIKNIIRIIRLILNEKKILFIDDDYTRLSLITNCFISIIYPFQWVHTYIPILSCQMFKYLESFLPFIIGIHTSFLPEVKKIFKKSSKNPDDQVFLVFIKEDKIRISDYLKISSNKMHKKEFLEKNVPHLPYSSGYNCLKAKLKKIKFFDWTLSKNKSKFNEEIINDFSEMFVEMFKDYNKYLYQIGEDIIFNKELFLKNKKKEDKRFYEEFFETQMFLQFKQDMVGMGYENFKKKVLEKEDKIYNKIRSTTTSLYSISSKKKDYIVQKKFVHYLNENICYNTKANILENELKFIDEKKYINSKCIIFLMPEILTIGNAMKEKYHKRRLTNINNLNDSFYIEDEDLVPKDKEKIEDVIKNYVIKIFKGEDFKILNDDNRKNEILKIINATNYGRHFFVNLISKNVTNFVVLPEEYFELLRQFTNNAITNILMGTVKLGQDENLDNEVLSIMKCSKHFGKEKKIKKIVTLWDDTKLLVKEFDFIYKKEFWLKWYDLEIKNNSKVNEDQLCDIQKEIIYEMSETMLDIDMSKKTIEDYLLDIMHIRFGKNEELIKVIKENIKKNLNNKKD